MNSYEEFKKEINSFLDKSFNYQNYLVNGKNILFTKILREYLVIKNKLFKIDNEQIRKELNTEIDTIMSNKILEVNPLLNTEIINKILQGCTGSYYKYPIDIYLVDNCIFIKQGEVNDKGKISKIKNIIYSNEYTNIFNEIDFIYDNKNPLKKNNFDNKDIKVFEFLCKNINNALKDRYNEDVCMYVDRNYKSIIPTNNFNINIYLDKKYKDISKGVSRREVSDINMLVQDEDCFYKYTFHQKKDRYIITWILEENNIDVWKLSNNSINNNKVKVKTKEKKDLLF